MGSSANVPFSSAMLRDAACLFADCSVLSRVVQQGVSGKCRLGPGSLSW